MKEFNRTKKCIAYGWLIVVFFTTSGFISRKHYEVLHNNPDLPVTHYLSGQEERSDIVYDVVSRSPIEANIVTSIINYDDDDLNQLTKI